jgi:hypothetical protein
MGSDVPRDRLDTVRQLIERMLAIGQRISDLSQDPGIEAMREIIDLRRNLGNQLPHLATACLEAIDWLAGEGHTDMRPQIISLVGDFRTQLSLLQSQWPAVAIRNDPAGYRRARSNLNVAQVKLFDWLNDRLIPALVTP